MRNKQRFPFLYTGFMILWFFIFNDHVTAQSNNEIINLSNSPGFSGFPAVACDPFGGIHVIWSEETSKDLELDTAGDALAYAYWDGVSWSLPNDVLISPKGYRANFPSIVSDDQGYIHVVWGGGPEVPLYYSRSPIQGATSAISWSKPMELAPSAYAPDISISPNGAIYVAYGQFPNNFGDPEGVFIVSSDDDGDTWNSPITIDSFIPSDQDVERVRLEIDPKERIHVVWNLVDSEGSTGVYYSRSEDAGISWSEVFTVATKSLEDFATTSADIAVIGEDEIHIVYLDGPSAYRYHRMSIDGGETWSESNEILPDLMGFAGFAGLSVDSSQKLNLVVDMRGRDLPNGISSSLHGHWWSVFNNKQWKDPKLIYGGYGLEEGWLHLQYPESVVCWGNTLVVVSHAVNTWEIYFVSMILDSPPQPTATLPTNNFWDENNSQYPVLHTPDLRNDINENDISIEIPKVISMKPYNSLAISIVSVFILVGGIIIFRLVKNKK